MPTPRGIVALAAPLLLLACSGGDERQVGGVSDDDAHRLNEAAEMLDADGVDLNTGDANSQDQP